MGTMSTTSTTTNQVNTRNGFYGKHHDEETKRRISNTQKMRYDYMRQMMKQHQQEQKQAFGPIDIDNPTLTQRIKEIVRELLQEQIKDATPTRRNIPLF